MYVIITEPNSECADTTSGPCLCHDPGGAGVEESSCNHRNILRRAKAQDGVHIIRLRLQGAKWCGRGSTNLQGGMIAGRSMNKKGVQQSKIRSQERRCWMNHNCDREDQADGS